LNLDGFLYEKCLAFVKQLILKQQLALKQPIKELSVKAQGIGADL